MNNSKSLLVGIAFGALAAIVGAIIWATVTVVSGYQIGYMAIGVGALVAFAVRFSGSTPSIALGVVSAVLALVGCMLGNLLSIVGFVAQISEIGYLEALINFDYTQTMSLMKETFAAMDLVFYGIAGVIAFQMNSTDSDTAEDAEETEKE